MNRVLGRVAVACVAFASSAAFAQSADGVLAPPPVLSPPLPPNLRISVGCADVAFVTAETGLAIKVDGQPVPAQGTDFATETGLTRHNNVITYSVATDVGFVVPSGHHQLQISAPGCTAVTREIEIPPGTPLRLDGALPTSPKWSGPVNAPDGVTLALGGFYSSFPSALTSGTTSGSGSEAAQYSYNPTSMGGFTVSSGIERRYFAFATDIALGGGSFSGEVTPKTGNLGPFPVSGSELVSALTFRVGARLPLHYVALEAGSGLGGSLWVATTAKVQTGNASVFDVGTLPSALETPQLFWHIPIWAALEVKPFCNWGAEVVASYNVDPSNLGANFFLLSAALMLQPASACSREPGLKAL